MSETVEALDAVADAYMARHDAVNRVKAKYAQYEAELAAAKQEGIDQVATALIAAWDAGASVAATGRAMGAANIYNARRVYYDRARAMQGEQDQDINDHLDMLYKKVRGESVPREPEPEQATVAASDSDAPEGTDEAWVNGWDISEPDENGGRKIFDMRGIAGTILKNGLLLNTEGSRLVVDPEVHALVERIHGIKTK